MFDLVPSIRPHDSAGIVVLHCTENGVAQRPSVTASHESSVNAITNKIWNSTRRECDNRKTAGLRLQNGIWKIVLQSRKNKDIGGAVNHREQPVVAFVRQLRSGKVGRQFDMPTPKIQKKKTRLFFNPRESFNKLAETFSSLSRTVSQKENDFCVLGQPQYFSCCARIARLKDFRIQTVGNDRYRMSA